jgi:glutamate synthase (NADPH/NADH) large chain
LQKGRAEVGESDFLRAFLPEGLAEAIEILTHWEAELGHFVQVCPTEMLPHLAHPLSVEPEAVPAE